MRVLGDAGTNSCHLQSSTIGPTGFDAVNGDKLGLMVRGAGARFSTSSDRISHS
jgi:hypothetical protein